MDFSINLTLFIQIFHFAVAYFILRKFFLKDAMDVLLAKEQDVARLRSEIESQNKVIVNKKTDIKNLWLSARERFTKFFVAMIPSWISSKNIPSITLKTLKSDQKNELKESLKDFIFKKVKNV